LGERAIARMAETTSSSFACDLKKWRQIMETYETGGHAYHATMPTDALRRVRDAMRDTESFGLELARTRQLELGARVRAMLVGRGYASVAAAGFEAPGVVVSYTTDPGIQSAQKFVALGLQAAAGVPLQCDEGADFRSFRVGLFGLDKLGNVDRTVASLEDVVKRLT
jgi:aspartate aminotransferase-like enzyme